MDKEATEGKKEATKTYLAQTTLLVTLSSAFLFAPAGLLAVLAEKRPFRIDPPDVWLFLCAELLFVFSVICGYVAIGSLAGSQDQGFFDIYRASTRFFSLLQFVLYLFGLGVFVILVMRLIA